MSGGKARHFGRGGAGNITTEPDPEPAFESSLVPKEQLPAQKYSYHTGRGGYGNIQTSDSLPCQEPEQFLAEAERASAVRKGQAYSTGRGGAGNIFIEGQQDTVSDLDKRRRNSNGGEGFFARVSNHFSSNHSKSHESGKARESEVTHDSDVKSKP